MSRAAVSISGFDASQLTNTHKLWLWTGNQDNRAFCLNRDLIRLPRLKQSNDIYVHRNRPCRSVEVVGIVVGSHLRSWDTSVEYLIDDGTEVISVHPVKITAADALAIVKKERAAAAAASASRLKEQLSSHPLPPPTDPHSQGIPEEYRPRIPQSVKDKENAILLKEKMAMEQEQTEVQIGTIVEVGQLVRVVGKIGFHRWAPDENLIVDATIESLEDHNEEALHIRKAVELAQTTYSDRFTLPDVQVNTTLQAPQSRRSRLGEALYNMIHCEDVEPIDEEVEDQGRDRDRSKKKKRAEESAKAKLNLKRRIFGNDDDDDDDDDSHTEDEEEVIKPKKIKIEDDEVKLERQRQLKRKIFGEDDDEEEIESEEHEQVFRSHNSMEKGRESSRSRLRRALFGDDDDEEEEQLQITSVNSSSTRTALDKQRLRERIFGKESNGEEEGIEMKRKFIDSRQPQGRMASFSGEKLRKQLLGQEEEEENDSHTEDEEEEPFINSKPKNQSRSISQSRPQAQPNKSEIAKRNLRRKILGEDDDSHTEDEEEEEEERPPQSKPFMQQKQVLTSSNKRKSALYKHLHPDEDDDEEASITFSQVNTPKASSYKSKSISAPKNQSSINTRTFTSSSSFKQPPSRQSRPEVNRSSSSISNQDIQYNPSPKGFKQKRDDSGLAGVASDSSNLKREGKVQEGSSKRQRISSQTSDVTTSSPKRSLKHWSKLRPSEQSVATFRFYVRMHINKYCRAISSSSSSSRSNHFNRSSNRESSPSSQQSRRRNISQSTDLETPKASSKQLYKGKARDLSSSILCPASDSEEDSRFTSKDSITTSSNRVDQNQPPIFTLAYLMRVKELRNHAREIVKINHKRDQKKSKSSSSSSSRSISKSLSNYEVEVRISRLFSETLDEMNKDGSLVYADEVSESIWPFNGIRNVERSDSEGEDDEIPIKFEKSILVQDRPSSQPTSSPSSKSVSSVNSTPSRNRKSSNVRPLVSNRRDPYLESFDQLKIKNKNGEPLDECMYYHSAADLTGDYSKSTSACIMRNFDQLPIFTRNPTFYQLVSSTLLKDPISKLLQSRRSRSSSNSSSGLSFSTLVERLKEDMRWEHLSEDKIKECLEKLRARRSVKFENGIWEWIAGK